MLLPDRPLAKGSLSTEGSMRRVCLVAWSFWLSPVLLTVIPQPSVPLSQLLNSSPLPDCLSSCSDPNMEPREESCSQLRALLSLGFPSKCMALKSGKTFIKCPLNTGSCTRTYISPAMFCLLIRTTWETFPLTDARGPCDRNPASTMLDPES